MSTFLGDALPEPLTHRLGANQALERSDRAIVICSIDEHGWPHPAMLSGLELVATDTRNVRLSLDTRSRTTRNLRANGRLTVIVADEDAVYYVKGDTLPLAINPSTPEMTRFNLRVDSVLQDAAGTDEHARIVTGIRITRDAMDPVAARQRLESLLGE